MHGAMQAHGSTVFRPPRGCCLDRPRPAKNSADVQRAHYTARRKEVWEALHPEPSVDYGREDGEEETAPTNCRTSLDTLPDGRKKGPQHHKGFAASTSEVTGENVRQIQRNVARAEAIGDDLLRLTGTSLDMASQNATPRAWGQQY